jgi:hypothetical protein
MGATRALASSRRVTTSGWSCSICCIRRLLRAVSC